VGLVHIAAARTGSASLHEEYRFGDISRGAIRLAAVERAIALVERMLADATQLADGHP
jgi:nicotinamide-nucleotide amidase